MAEASGPSDKAVEAARVVGPFRFLRADEQSTSFRERQARDVLDAAHDPALGLDRSVCLRDVVQTLRDEARALDNARRDAEREGHGRPTSPVSANGARAVAAYIERTFGDGG
jgi:hypothetical protein